VIREDLAEWFSRELDIELTEEHLMDVSPNERLPFCLFGIVGLHLTSPPSLLPPTGTGAVHWRHALPAGASYRGKGGGNNGPAPACSRRRAARWRRLG
jgi:hypothetical protein